MIFRPATKKDSAFLFMLRNEPSVIEMSATGRGVNRPEHARWLAKALQDEAVQIYIAEMDTRTEAWQPSRIRPVGMGRINLIEPGIAVLSYAVSSPYRQSGIGTNIIYELGRVAKKLGCRHVQALVQFRNTASLKALLSSEFTVSEHELLRLEKTL
jgi:RimJ/RimL family protein N-acetyltransferase